MRWRRLTPAGTFLAALVVLVVALLGCGGSHPRPRPADSAAAAATDTGTSPRRSGASNEPAGNGSPSRQSAGTAESPQVRALVALVQPIYCAGLHGNEVALTFDDGPGPYTQLVMRKLRKHGVGATFFVV